MIKELLLASSSLSTLSVPISRNYSHTIQEGNVNITYEFETNEVSSIDDLIPTRIYRFDIPDDEVLVPSDIGNFNFTFSIVNGFLSLNYVDNPYIDEQFSILDLNKYSFISLDLTSDSVYCYIGGNDENYVIVATDSITSIVGHADILIHDVYYEPSDYYFNVDYFSASNFNVITNVQEIYHTGLFGNLADFLRYHIYGGIPYVSEISFEVANKTITMLDWLVVSTSIVLAVLCLVLLYIFIRWLVKLFSNTLLLR